MTANPSLSLLAAIHLLAGRAPQPLLFTPDASIALLTLSGLLIFWELHRPGIILPGAVGLLGVLLVIASWSQWHLHAFAVVLLLVGAALPIVQMRRVLPPSWIVWMLAATLLVALGCGLLVAGPPPVRVHWPVAMLCGMIFGTGGSLLLRIGGRARRNKGLN